MKTKNVLLSTIFMMLFTSCATIFTGTKSRIILESNVTNADKVTIDGYNYKNITFPFTVKIRRGFNETIVKAERTGYEAQILLINKNLNTVSIINLANVLGWGIDAATVSYQLLETN